MPLQPVASLLSPRLRLFCYAPRERLSTVVLVRNKNDVEQLLIQHVTIFVCPFLAIVAILEYPQLPLLDHQPIWSLFDRYGMVKLLYSWEFPLKKCQYGW